MLTIVAGYDADFDLEARHNDGTPGGAAVAGLLASDPIAALVWPGDDEPQTFAPTIAWTDAPNGLAQLTFLAAQTANVDPGKYRVQAWATAGGKKLLLLDDELTIEAGPGDGSTAVETSLVSYRDMTRYANFLDRLANPERHGVGFSRARGEATRWFLNKVIRHYRGGAAGLVARDYSLDHMYYGLRRTLLPPTELIGWLAAGRLLLDATDLATGATIDLGVREVVARYAIGLVCAGQLGPGKGNEYAAFARAFLEQAEEGAKGLTVQIDSDGDGIADLWVDLGSAQTFYA